LISPPCFIAILLAQQSGAFPLRDPRGWPDTENPGVPLNPAAEGPHWIEDEHGERRWAWWLPVSGKWLSCQSMCPAPLVARRWTYLGAALAPEQPAQRQRRFG